MANVTDIDGVGSSRAETLAEEGYESLEDIAGADPAELAESVSRVSEDKAVEFTLQAENLLPDEPSEEDVLGPLADDSEEDSEAAESDSEDFVEEEDESDSEEKESSSDDADGSSGEDTYSIELESTDETSETEFVTAVTEARSRYKRQNPTRHDACVDILEQYRENGVLSFELNRLQLDTLHAVLRSRKNDYQGKNQIDARNVVEDLQKQVQAAREENFL